MESKRRIKVANKRADETKRPLPLRAGEIVWKDRGLLDFIDSNAAFPYALHDRQSFLT